MKLSELFFKKSGAVIDKKLDYHDAMGCVDSLVRCAQSPLEKVRAYNYALFVIKADYSAYSKTQIFKKGDPKSLADTFPDFYYTETGEMKRFSNDGRTCKISLNNNDSIAVSAWNCKRLADILPVIYRNGFTADDNHRAKHFSEIDLTVVYCGNHSISAGIFLETGEIEAELYDISELYEHLDTDGYNWINRHNGRIISKVDFEHIAIMYEIARRKSVLLKSLDSRTEEYCRENGGAFIKRKRQYTVVCGMPCSGKSTYIGAVNHCGEVLIDDGTDMDKFRLLIEQRECIIDENVFTGNAIPRMKLARDSGYYVRLCFIGIGSADECIRRSELRLQKTGVRRYSDEVIRESLKNYPRLIAQMLDLCDSADFCDNENGFRYVARWDGKTFNFISGDMPDWLCKIHLARLDLNSQA